MTKPLPKSDAKPTPRATVKATSKPATQRVPKSAAAAKGAVTSKRAAAAKGAVTSKRPTTGAVEALRAATAKRASTGAADPLATAGRPVKASGADPGVALSTAIDTPVTTTAEAASPVAPTSGDAPRRARAVAKARKAAADADRSALEVARRIVELAEDKKAADIVLLDLGGLTTLADYFVVCSGGSERQLDAIANGIISGMRDEKIRPFGREGTPASHWVLVDFGIVIVHIFTPPERDFYQLEKHWSEARTVLRVQ